MLTLVRTALQLLDTLEGQGVSSAAQLEQYTLSHGDAGPSSPSRVLFCAARTLNATGQSRVTLSLH